MIMFGQGPDVCCKNFSASRTAAIMIDAFYVGAVGCDELWIGAYRLKKFTKSLSMPAGTGFTIFQNSPNSCVNTLSPYRKSLQPLHRIIISSAKLCDKYAT